ncbi:MAG: PaaI family thioesterase [Acidaminococcales bacterium]|jgi:acyl-CoA thioesterase|nr:PaaI family thioesterase [Acidaminococcales bacterium]
MEFKKIDDTASPLYKDDLLSMLLEQNPAVAVLEPSGMTIKEDCGVEIALPIKDKHTNIYGAVHGGVFVSVLDTVMGYACHLKVHSSIVTLNITTSFIANCGKGALVNITGRAVHAGRRIVVAEGEARTQEGELLATAQGTFFVLGEHPAGGIKAPDTIAKKYIGIGG